MDNLKIYDGMGDFVAEFRDIHCQARAIANCFTGCWVNGEDREYSNLLAQFVRVETKELRSRRYLYDASIVKVEFRPAMVYNYAIVSSNIKTRQPEIQIIITGGRFGLRSDFVDTFTEMMNKGEKVDLILTKEHVIIQWGETNSWSVFIKEIR